MIFQHCLLGTNPATINLDLCLELDGETARASEPPRDPEPPAGFKSFRTAQLKRGAPRERALSPLGRLRQEKLSSKLAGATKAEPTGGEEQIRTSNKLNRHAFHPNLKETKPHVSHSTTFTTPTTKLSFKRQKARFSKWLRHSGEICGHFKGGGGLTNGRTTERRAGTLLKSSIYLAKIKGNAPVRVSNFISLQTLSRFLYPDSTWGGGICS